MRLETSVDEIAFDSRRNALWFASFDGAPPGHITKYSIGSGNIEQFVLSRDPGPGVTTHVRVAPDGTVWVSRDYRIDRLDPETGQTRSINLPEDLDGAKGPGTWISALTFDADGHALVARNNAPVLQVFDSALHLNGHIPLPAGFTGVVDMSVGTNGLRVFPPHDGSSVEPTVKTVAVVAASSSEVVSPLRDSRGANMTLLVVRPNDDVILYNQITGQLVWRRADGTQRTVTFPVEMVERNAPNGDLVQVPVREDVTAAVVDNADTLWFVATGRAGMILQSATS